MVVHAGRRDARQRVQGGLPDASQGERGAGEEVWIALRRRAPRDEVPTGGARSNGAPRQLPNVPDRDVVLLPRPRARLPGAHQELGHHVLSPRG